MKKKLRFSGVLTLVSFFVVVSAFHMPAQIKPYESQVPRRLPGTATPTEPAPQRQEYTVSAKDFKDEGKNYGFNWKAHPKDPTSDCIIGHAKSSWSRDKSRASVAVISTPLTGSKCDFTVNEPATLKNGFVFKSYRGEKEIHGKSDVSITSSPSPGSTSIKFTLHGWSEGGGGNYANYDFSYFILEGPAGRDWKDALR